MSSSDQNENLNVVGKGRNQEVRVCLPHTNSSSRGLKQNQSGSTQESVEQVKVEQVLRLDNDLRMKIAAEVVNERGSVGGNLVRKTKHQ
jgi:hypothetical protein